MGDGLLPGHLRRPVWLPMPHPRSGVVAQCQEADEGGNSTATVYLEKKRHFRVLPCSCALLLPGQGSVSISGLETLDRKLEQSHNIVC